LIFEEIGNILKEMNLSNFKIFRNVE
jgi:hypothetical protein